MTTATDSSIIFPSFKDSVFSIRQLVPITLRGVLFLCLVIYLALGPARYDTDIVASVVSYSILAAVFPLLGITLLIGTKLKRSLSLVIGASERKIGTSPGEDRIESGTIARLILRLSEIKIPALFVLKVIPKFSSEELTLSTHIISGSSPQSRYLIEDVSFPHRGVWSLNEVKVQFGDQFGLFSMRWSLGTEDLHGAYGVYPPKILAPNLPVVSSCERPGDLVSHVRERQGDPFDIRQYHPSDGARRILWKVFAKRGELVSRHPEASMTPEGQVVIFAPLSKREDSIAGIALSYMRQLEELNLQLFFGCLGMNGVPAARDAIEAEELLVDTAWHIVSDTSQAERECSKFLELTQEAIGNESQLRRIILFTSPDRFVTALDRDIMVAILRHLISRSIIPVVIANEASTEYESAATIQSNNTYRKAFLDLVVENRASHQANPNLYRSFLTLCAAEGWEVILVPKL